MNSAISKKTATLWLTLLTVTWSLPVTAGELAGDAEGAKGLFFQQMESPYKSLNTGVQYYIELHRDGRLAKVTNKYGFRSGDRIKFHVRSNIDGYAYILLKSGSRGEQSVLFPDPEAGEDNLVKRGEDYVLPASGYLTFDDNPGTEKVSLVLSRTPIDATTYLNKPVEAPTLIASAMTGAKDLIPQRVLVHYSDAPTRIASAQAGKPPASSSVAEVNLQHKPGNIGKRKEKVAIKKISVPQSSKKKSKIEQEGTVTVVSELPGSVLHIDVDLHHI